MKPSFKTQPQNGLTLFTANDANVIGLVNITVRMAYPSIEVLDFAPTAEPSHVANKGYLVDEESAGTLWGETVVHGSIIYSDGAAWQVLAETVFELHTKLIANATEAAGTPLGDITTTASPTGSEVAGSYYSAVTVGTYTNFLDGDSNPIVTTAARQKIKKASSGAWFIENDFTSKTQNLTETGTLPAANVSRGASTVDADLTALETLPGAGRTTETVKRNADNAQIEFANRLAMYNSNYIPGYYKTKAEFLLLSSVADNTAFAPTETAAIGEYIDDDGLSNTAAVTDTGKQILVKGSTGYSVETIDKGAIQQNENRAISGNDAYNYGVKNEISRIRKIKNSDIVDGDKTIMAETSDVYDNSVVIEKNVDGDYFVYQKSGTGNVWTYFNIGSPSGDGLIHIRFKVEFNNTITTNGVVIVLAEGTGVGTGYNNLQSITESGEYDITFDPEVWNTEKGYYPVYVWINNQNINAGETIIATFTNFHVYELINRSLFVKISGENSKELFEDIDSKLGVSQLEYIENGTEIIYGDVSNMASAGITERNIAEDYFIFSHVGTGNLWTYSPDFVPDGSQLIRITFNVEFNNVGTSEGITFVVAELPTTAGKFFNIQTISENGTYEVTFDPAYYAVYEGFSSFRIWINNRTILAGQEIHATFSNFKILEYEGSVEGTYISGRNIKELTQSTDSRFGSVYSSIGNIKTLVSPSGGKYELSVTNAGLLTAIPVIPDKALFVGNSLIGGFGGYGMAASESQYDYYNRINAAILSINSSYTSSKGSNSLETLATTNTTTIDAEIQASFLDYLDGTENLVVVQLGDNVNTAARLSSFEVWCQRLLLQLRDYCPSARVVWLGMWYSSVEKVDIIQAACESTGCRYININSLTNESGARSFLGALYYQGTGSREILNITNVVENTATNITVTFDVGEESVEVTMDVDSYSLDGTTLTYTGLYGVIQSSGVASHPSDEGFRLIANKFLYELGMVSTEEYYV